MACRTVREIMVPLSEYVIVSEEETIRGAMGKLRESQFSMPPDRYYHRATLVRNERGNIVGKLGYHGFLAALDPKYENLEELKNLAGSGITKKDLNQEMRDLGFWDEKFPIIKETACDMKMKQVMVKFEEHVEETDSLAKAMHMMVQLQVNSLLTVQGDRITGIVRLSDLFEAIADCILEDD